jgi:hypothetical protein
MQFREADMQFRETDMQFREAIMKATKTPHGGN